MKGKHGIAAMLGMVCLLLIWSTIGQCSVGRFIFMNENENYSYYLDADTVRYIPDPYRDEKLMDAWIKVVPTETGRQSEIKTRLANNLQVAGYDEFNYSMRRYYFRVSQRQIQRMYLRDFSGSGKVLDTQSYKYEAIRWEELVPNSLGDVWHSFIIKHLSKKVVTPGDDNKLVYD